MVNDQNHVQNILFYLFGLSLLAFGTSMMEKAGLGMSMVVAPAYVVYLWISQYISWFTFGFGEYLVQILLLLGLWVVLNKFKREYLFSFVTAILYGFLLDRFIGLFSAFGISGIVPLVLLYCGGFLLCAFGVALLFHTSMAPEAYELFVKELANEKHWQLHKVKTVYDMTSLIVAVVLSFVFFASIRGVQYGTVICAFLNGPVIGFFDRWIDRVILKR